MRIVCISDLHGHKITPPDGDLLIIAGDLTSVGRPTQVEDMGLWLAEHADRYVHGVVYVAGNHDWLYETNRNRAVALMNPKKNEKIRYLQQQSCVIEGIKFYGFPCTPSFCNWAFNKDQWDMEVICSKIPTDTDVVISHGPPYGIMDLVPRGELVGCNSLRLALFDRVMPKLHVFGHIHCGHGMQDIEGIKFVNASICTEAYEPINEPIVVEI